MKRGNSNKIVFCQLLASVPMERSASMCTVNVMSQTLLSLHVRVHLNIFTRVELCQSARGERREQ